jgi:hypothetical protein
MAITVTINPRTNVISKVQQKKTAVSSINVGPQTSLTLGQILNVDASDPDNGETLVYDEQQNKYVVKEITVTSNNIINVSGGTF